MPGVQVVFHQIWAIKATEKTGRSLQILKNKACLIVCSFLFQMINLPIYEIHDYFRVYNRVKRGKSKQGKLYTKPDKITIKAENDI